MKSLLASLGIMILFATALAAQAVAPDPLQAQMNGLGQEGRKLTAEEAAQIEMRLQDQPDNLEDRVRLLGFYSFPYNSQTAQRRQKHVQWLIENHPDNPACGTWAYIMPGDPGYEQVKQLWLEYGRTRKEPAILRSAGRYFTGRDTTLAAQFLQQGEVLTPTDPYWAQQLGMAYAIQARTFGLKASSRIRYATLAVEAFERGRQLNPSFPVSWIASEAAFIAEHWDKAKEWATVSVSSSNLANIHYGHWILGEVALHEGDIDKAKQELLLSANMPDNQDIGVTNLRMNLADKLLKLGERDVVLTYLERCSGFLKSGQDKLKEWTVLIKNGLDPDFGMNGQL